MLLQTAHSARAPAQSSRVSREGCPYSCAYGPDYYGYFSGRITIGALGERNILVRVVDDSRYPPEWKQFMRWKQDYGLHHIAINIIVEDDYGCAGVQRQ